jgi:hypothetical protein
MGAFHEMFGLLFTVYPNPSPPVMGVVGELHPFTKSVLDKVMLPIAILMLRCTYTYTYTSYITHTHASPFFHPTT